MRPIAGRFSGERPTVPGTVAPVSDWSPPSSGSSLGVTQLATALRTLLIVAAMLSGALAFLAVRMRAALEDVGPSPEAVGGGRANAQEAVDAFFGGATVYFLALAVIGVLFVTWMWRAARNNESFGRPGALGPGWAIGGWFIPLASLALPVVQMQQLWRGADGSVGRDDPEWRRGRAASTSGSGGPPTSSPRCSPSSASGSSPRPTTPAGR